MSRLFGVRLGGGREVLAARQVARRLAARLGFEHLDQARIATAVSELLRSAAAEDGLEAVVEFAVEDDGDRQALVIRASGEGLGRERRPPPAAGVRGTGGQVVEDVAAARRLLDPGGAADAPGSVSLERRLPRNAPRVTAELAREIRTELESRALGAEEGYRAELLRQDRGLAAALLELERRQQELARLGAELDDTNRGVMALYAELDERANRLLQADELKTRFFSNMSHEFKTPLNSVLALSNLLLEQADGSLNDEQTRQVELIRGTAQELFELVSDLLDLAKVEAGKSSVSIGPFSVEGLFGALRGMIRPLLPAAAVSLEFEAPADLPQLIGDEGKVAQILRNFLSNAAKFTEAGSITVSAHSLAAGERLDGLPAPVPQESVLFCVADTGIGIARGDQDRIFDEFTQVGHSLQRGVRGTGLGLPLCRKLASLLGGRVWVESEIERGSKFYFLVPRVYPPDVESFDGVLGRDEPGERAAEEDTVKAPGAVVDGGLGRLLLVDDDESFRALLAKYAAPFCRDTVASANAERALDLVRAGDIDCAVLDLVMPGLDGFTLLKRLRDDPATRTLPVIVCSSKELSKQERVLLRELDSAFLPKHGLAPESLARALVEAGARARSPVREASRIATGAE